MRRETRKTNNSKKAIVAHEASGQAQKERQAQVTSTQSLTLVKNLIRVSISTVCHMRGIFPHGCFQNRTYAGMNIYQLDSASRDAETGEMFIKDQEAYDFTLWLESGVFEAVEHRYLRRMEFIIASPAHGNNPREAYAFDLTYLEDSEDAVVLFNGTEVTTVENTKVQLVQLIRSLVALGSTLGDLPKERILNIKLWYFDERTPPGWQPNHFRDADPSELKFKNARDDPDIDDKLKIKIGDLKTPHHTLSLVFTGYDNQEQPQNPDQTQRGQGQQRTIGKASAAGNSGSASEGSEDGLQEGDMSDGDSDDDSDDEQEEIDASRDGGWVEEGGLLTCKVGPAGDEDDDDADHDDNGTDRDRDEQETDEETDEETEVPDAVTSRRAVSRLASGMRNSLNIASDERDPDDSNMIKDTRNGRNVQSIVGQEVRPANNETTSEYDAAKAWVVTQARPTQTGLMNNLETTREAAREFLDRMVQEGILVKKNFRYHRAERSQGSRDVQPEPEAGERSEGDEEQESSVSDDSATQIPPEAMITTASTCQTRDRRNKHTSPSSMPCSMPPPPSIRRRGERGGGGCTPEAPGGDNGGNGGGRGRDFDTPPVPTSVGRPNPQPVPEKPQRAMMMSMGTKRVLDESALSRHPDDDDNDDNADNDRTMGSKSKRSLHDQPTSQMPRNDAEPMDVFDPSELDSQPGYERLLLSQDSTASATGKPKRKCSVAINPIYQSVPSKRLRVDQKQGRE